MPRTTRALPVAARPYHTLMASGGNGAPAKESDTERLKRVESVVETMRHELDVQLQRMAELQAQLDRAIADRPLPPR